MNAWLAGFTQPGEHMRCPFLAPGCFDCSERLYYSIEALTLHMYDAHGVGLHEIAEA